MTEVFLPDGEQVIFTTVTTASYLPQAIIMAKSVKQHMPNGKVIACIIEKQIPSTSEGLDNYFDSVILAKDLGFQNFHQFMFQYHQAEGSNACKAKLLIYLLEIYPSHNYFVFLDADTKIFGPFDELTEYFQDYGIILSPHFIRFNEANPFYHLATVHLSGIFNTGFFALKRGDEAYRFLHWWAELLAKYCYIDTEKGIWNEQKWLDLAPGLFDFHIHTDPGYNVGPWNFHERPLAMDENGEYTVNGSPLRLFHFSGAIKTKYFTDRMNQAKHEQKLLIDQLRAEYLQEAAEADKDELSSWPWSYGNFDNGNLIEYKSRLIFRKYAELFSGIDNPFLKDNRFFAKYKKRKK